MLPKPKRVVVQALPCERKSKFEDFKPIIQNFVDEVALDIHTTVAAKREEIRAKNKTLKFMVIFDEVSQETGPKQFPEAS